MLGAIGVVLTLAAVAGLQLWPDTFVPMAQVLATWLSGVPLRRLPDDPSYWTGLAVLVGATWTVVFALTMWKQPKQDRTIDQNLRKRLMIDNARRATIDPED